MTFRTPVHRRSNPPAFCQVALTVLKHPFILLGGEVLWEQSVLPKNTTQWLRTAFKPGPLDPESSMLTISCHLTSHKNNLSSWLPFEFVVIQVRWISSLHLNADGLHVHLPLVCWEYNIWEQLGNVQLCLKKHLLTTTTKQSPDYSTWCISQFQQCRSPQALVGQLLTFVIPGVGHWSTPRHWSPLGHLFTSKNPGFVSIYQQRPKICGQLALRRS